MGKKRRSTEVEDRAETLTSGKKRRRTDVQNRGEKMILGKRGFQGKKSRYTGR
jgi:hypothetical protein